MVVLAGFKLTDQPNLKALGLMVFLVLIWCTLAHPLAALIDSGLSLLASSLVPTGVPRMVPARMVIRDWAFLSEWIYPFVPPFLLIAPAAYLVSIYGALLIFGQTMSRCRINPIHLIRIVGYAFLPLRYWFLGYVLLFTSQSVYRLLELWFVPASVSWVPRFMMIAGEYMWFGLLALSMVSIPIGLHRYLKLPRGWLMGLSVDVIALLVLLNLVFWVRFL